MSAPNIQSIEAKEGEDVFHTMSKERGEMFEGGIENDERINMAWVETAVKHAQTYSRLLRCFSDKTKLKLTKVDDDIYSSFRAEFPDLNIQSFTDDDIKSEAVKPQWRKWMMSWEKVLPDNFHYLTLIRLNSAEDYSQENSTVVPRIQFLAIELARNREGYNDSIKFDDDFLN
ncbi:hypothetical protein P9112_004233 [Eukaryota sp. TZLM1-RC]